MLDISERKQMEQALSERERLLRMVMDTQQEMIVRWLPDRTVVFVNQAVCRFSGRNKSQLIGRAWLSRRPAVAGPFNALEWQHDHAGQVQPLRREREMLDGSGNRRRSPGPTRRFSTAMASSNASSRWGWISLRTPGRTGIARQRTTLCRNLPLHVPVHRNPVTQRGAAGNQR